MEVLESSPQIELADELHRVENQIRLLEASRDRLKIDLAAAIYQAGQNDVIGSYGQKYVISRPNTKYTFRIPDEEFDRLGLTEICTPPAPPPPGPKLNKTELDKLLKTRKLDDQTVLEWQQKGWYQVDRSDEITVKQVQTKLEELKATVGF